ncbi:MAG: type pilus assembly protein PilO [Acidobacteriaceae bacterium]|jgi:type IV pilus assembly protein PilO|nr:type pilus assembly protein PilO [Acidobacteriaceae bacterium]
MENPLRDMSVIVQALVAAALAVVIVLIGVYLPFSPVAQERSSVDKAIDQRKTLSDEVTQLQVYKQRYGELKQQMDALSKQLETLKAIVPEEKEVDEFIRLVQGAAASSNVTIRRFTAQAVVPREFHYEMPFEMQADGAYFNLLDFFGRMSRLSRIINVGDLKFEDPEKAAGKYPLRPGTTVSGVFTATTFFTKPADASAAPATGAKTQPAAAGKP